jgi:hypothetical protein
LGTLIAVVVTYQTVITPTALIPIVRTPIDKLAQRF